MKVKFIVDNKLCCDLSPLLKVNHSLRGDVRAKPLNKPRLLVDYSFSERSSDAVRNQRQRGRDFHRSDIPGLEMNPNLWFSSE